MKFRARVWENKGNGQLLITIPKISMIKAGEYVLIEKDESIEVRNLNNTNNNP